MEDYSELLKALLEEEEQLQFSKFTNECALQLGNIIIERAKQENKSITVDICRNGQLLFHAALSGTTIDNNSWIIRKNRVVNRFGHSSYYLSIWLKSLQAKNLKEVGIDPSEYAFSGGAFPIIIRDVGIVGSITVSGLTEEEDHKLVTSVIQEFIRKE